jgi:hypothetical protein
MLEGGRPSTHRRLTLLLLHARWTAGQLRQLLRWEGHVRERAEGEGRLRHAVCQHRCIACMALWTCAGMRDGRGCW